MKDLCCFNGNIVSLTTNIETYISESFSYTFAPGAVKQEVYLKDLFWDLSNEKDWNINKDCEQSMIECIVNRILEPDRFCKEDIIEAIEYLGIKIDGNNLSKESLTKLNITKLEKLLKKIKEFHKIHISTFGCEIINYPTPLFGIIRFQGFSLCQELDEVDEWFCKIAKRTQKLLNMMYNKKCFMKHITSFWDNSENNDDRCILILSMLNACYLSSYYYFEKNIKKGLSIRETMKSLPIYCAMSYEIESLINSLLRNRPHIITKLLNKISHWIEITPIEESDSITNSINQLAELHSIIIEFLGTCVRNSYKALYSIILLANILMEIILVTQNDEYVDLYSDLELRRLKIEFLPRFISAYQSTFALYWSLNQNINNQVNFLGTVHNNSRVSISSLAVLNSLNDLHDNFSKINEPYKYYKKLIHSTFRFILPWDKLNNIPEIMKLLLKYQEFKKLQILIKIIKQKSSAFNFINLYCNIELNDLKGIQKCIAETSAYHHAKDPLFTDTQLLLSFIKSIGLIVNSDTAIYNDPEMNYYSIFLDIIKKTSYEAQNSIITTALWTKNNDHDNFWEKFAELCIGKQKYIKAYLAIGYIKDEAIRVNRW